MLISPDSQMTFWRPSGWSRDCEGQLPCSDFMHQASGTSIRGSWASQATQLLHGAPLAPGSIRNILKPHAHNIMISHSWVLRSSKAQRAYAVCWEGERGSGQLSGGLPLSCRLTPGWRMKKETTWGTENWVWNWELHSGWGLKCLCQPPGHAATRFPFL